MRKALCLTVLLAALAVGCLAGGFGWVNAAADQVTLTPVTHYGDPAAAKGLTLQARTTLSRSLVWDTVYPIDDPAAIQTDYAYYDMGYAYPWSVDGYRVELQNYVESAFSHDAVEDGQWGLNKAYKQLYDATEPGTENTMTVRLADYFDYYPLGVFLSSPGAQFGMNEAEYMDVTGGDETVVPEPDSWPGMFLAFREFFRIPVLPEETLELSIGLYEDGRVAHMGSGSTESDAFYLNSYEYSAYAGGAIFFTFDPHTRNGALVDTSLIPGGYGLYRLPMLTTEQQVEQQRDIVFLAEELEMVYPLDPNSHLVSLSVDKAGSVLRLVAVEGDMLVLTILDPVRFQTLQRIELTEWTADWYGGISLYDGGDFLALELPGSRMAVVSVRDSGRYVPEFFVSTNSEVYDELIHYYFFYNSGCSMDFDGQKLAILAPAASYHGDSCDAYLLIYDRTGLVYLGEYRSSMTPRPGSGEYDYNYPVCRFLDERPLVVTWADRWYGPEG